MKRSASFAVLIYLMVVQGSSSSSAQSPELAEKNRLNQTITELYKQGKYSEAVPLAKRALEIEKTRGLTHAGVVLALANLGELYLALGKNGQAESTLQEALTILDTNQIDSQVASSVMESLAQLSFRKKETSRAIDLLERSLAIRERLFGRESNEVAETLHELANVYRFTRRDERAEELYLRSIQILEKTAGRKHPQTISTLKDYACLGFRELRVISVKEEDKKEDEKELSDAEKEKRSIKERARCWLSGFEDDCENKTYTRKSITVLNGKATKLAQPAYPHEARVAGASGLIIIAVRINIDGRVIDARPVCGGQPTLFSTSLKAARASEFTPTLIDGKPTTVSGVIIYNFVRQ